MPLYIKDDTVDELVEQVMGATKAKTKTDAIRQALEEALENQGQSPLFEQIEPLQARVENLGPVDPDFDMKSFTDELWADEISPSRY